MKFNKNDLWDVMDSKIGEPTDTGFTLISDEMVSKRRWSLEHYMVFKFGGKVYGSYYSTGATEQQDESPYQYEGDEIECEELEPVEVTKIEYRVKKKEVA